MQRQNIYIYLFGSLVVLSVWLYVMGLFLEYSFDNFSMILFHRYFLYI